MIKTTCKKCVYKIVENEIQTGCELGRLEIFQKRGEANISPEGFFDINSLCNTCREERVDNIKEDISIPFYIFVNCTDTDKVPVDLINQINDCKYKKKAVHFLFSKGKFTDLYNKIEETAEFPFKLTKLISEEYLNTTIGHEVNKLPSNSFSCFIDGFCEYGSQPEEINSRVNDRLVNCVLFIDEQMVCISSKILQRLYSGHTQEMSLDYYISEIFNWAKIDDKEHLIWIK